MKRLLLLPACLLVAVSLRAQETPKWGTLSGSLESNSIYYMKDSKLGDVLPTDHFGSNNYLRFDYRIGRFSAGLQYEAYLPVLQGFPGRLKDADIMLKYVAFSDGNLSVLAGDFYEQFGSGLILRAYEERSLGVNTSLEGVRGAYNFGGKVNLKAVYGRPRKFMEHAGSWVRGADLNFDMGSLLRFNAVDLNIAGSFVNRYEMKTRDDDNIKANIDAWAFRLNLDAGGFSLRGEYVTKGKDAAAYNDYMPERGNALLAEVGYAGKGFGALLTFRRLEYMAFHSEREETELGTELNYLPALTRQYTYLLTNLNPYSTQVNGEIGGQADLYYNFPKNSFLGGKNGLKLAVNFSAWYNLKGNVLKGYDFGFGKELYFRDLSVDIVKKLSRSVKMVLLYSMQEFNPVIVGHDGEKNYKSNIVIGDITWKITPKNSLRIEGQHLWTEQDKKNWAAALVEFSMAPRWSLFASDMFNYGGEDEMHYYNGGISYVHSRSRIALNYGRNRAGYNCAGGVCRLIPAYTGFNLTLTTSF